MIAHKHITRIVVVLTVVFLGLCLTAMAFSDTLAEAAGGTGVTMEYEEKLFDTSAPITVNILMDASEWEEMLDNATAEQYHQCDVEIQGQTFYQVGIRPKGNTSLTSIASDPDTDRFSLKLEFDQYVDDQTCFGLDKLILNNNYADATNMKEALIYDMFQYLGADASLYNYAAIYVNGEYWGVYLALEAVEDSFLLRNYGVDSGKLYKPDSLEMGGGAPAADDRRAGQGDFSMVGNGGSNLNYTDDELDSYSTIWDGAVTGASESDHRRVVTALKHIAEGDALETYMDIDNLLKYMAVHVFSVNQDSLSGNMAHNYYLYESGGQLNLLPWDYNLALGGMGESDASATINDAIDSPWEGTRFFDTLMENEAYQEQYHAYLQQLVDEYINNGGLDAFYTRTRSQIDALVEADPTAFYTYSEYTAAVEMLYDTVQLRGASISGQLDGTIPATDTEQRENSTALLDASSIDLSVMGGMDMGGINMGGGTPDDMETGRPESGMQGGFDVSQFGDEALEAFAAFQPGGDVQNVGFGGSGNTTAMNNLIAYGICFAGLIAALLFAAFYRRKSRRR